MAVKKKTEKTKKTNSNKRRYGWVPDLPDRAVVAVGYNDSKKRFIVRNS